MTEARDLLREARAAAAPELAIETALGGSDAWRSLFDEIDAAVRAAIDAIDDEVEAATLTGRDDAGEVVRGHRLGQLSERCVEAITFDGLYEVEAQEIVPLWRALAAASDDDAVAAVLDGGDPADALDDVESAITLVANDDRDLGEARFDSPIDVVWEPIERVIIAAVDGNLEHRFGHPVEY
ncbi:hypothetical protein GCM10011490_21190 [Pseudoclavibacter endophyticus]|uniref:Uncharacterized protein n=1 Tax=Pseudoclavibacter endophyticus TaxID=1778590 RepID=A0A6H9WBX8_9MICO|nr:hypothetical protein [Pseudoclavibacter endophyticus]KAB1648170.1 hypothetical protein F8O04_10660 [Pseudoclavibacter endophyticus]GGA70307.1 hypothetical protein GCM10011490_21190 [Pseudoclavibacter endophyticus]